MKSQEEYGLIEFSLKYPFSNKDSRLGGVISCIAGLLTIFTIVPIILVVGYLSEMRKSVINKEEQAPKFEYYNDLYREGKGSIMTQLPPYFIATTGVLCYLIIQTPIAFGFIYLSYLINPIVKVRYAAEGNYTEVYDGKILQALFDETYIKYHAVYTGMLMFFTLLSIGFGLFTVGLGLIIGVSVLIVVRPVFWGYVYENKLSHIFNE